MACVLQVLVALVAKGLICDLVTESLRYEERAEDHGYVDLCSEGVENAVVLQGGFSSVLVLLLVYIIEVAKLKVGRSKIGARTKLGFVHHLIISIVEELSNLRLGAVRVAVLGHVALVGIL